MSPSSRSCSLQLPGSGGAYNNVGEGNGCVGGSGGEVILGRQTLPLDVYPVNDFDKWGMGIDTDTGLGSGDEGYTGAASYSAGISSVDDVLEMGTGIDTDTCSVADGVWRDLYPGMLEYWLSQ